MEEVLGDRVLVILILDGVERQLVAQRRLEHQVRVIDLIELNIPVEIEEEREVRITALIPVGRDVGLRELDTVGGGVEPVGLLEIGGDSEGLLTGHVGDVEALDEAGKRIVVGQQARRLGELPREVCLLEWMVEDVAVLEVGRHTGSALRPRQPKRRVVGVHYVEHRLLGLKDGLVFEGLLEVRAEHTLHIDVDDRARHVGDHPFDPARERHPLQMAVAAEEADVAGGILIGEQFGDLVTGDLA